MGQQDGLAYGVVGRNTYVPFYRNGSGRSSGGFDIPNIKQDKSTGKQPAKGTEFSPRLFTPELGLAKDVNVEMMPLDYQYYTTVNNHLETSKYQLFNYIAYAQESGQFADPNVQSTIIKLMGDITMKSNEVGLFMQKAKEFKDSYKTDFDYYRDQKQGQSAINMKAMTADGELIYYVNGKGYLTESEIKEEEKNKALPVTVYDYLNEYKSGYLNSVGGRKREYMNLFHYDVNAFNSTINETIKSEGFKNYMGQIENTVSKGVGIDKESIKNAAFEYIANSLNITPVSLTVEEQGQEVTGAAYTRNFTNANNFNIVKAISGSTGEFMGVKEVHDVLDPFARQNVENTYNITFGRPTAQQAMGFGGLSNFITNRPEFLEPVKTADLVTVELYRPRDYQSNYASYRHHITEGLDLMKDNYPEFKKIIENQAKYQYLSVDYESLENDAKMNLYLNHIFRTKYSLGNDYVMDKRKYNKVKFGYALNSTDMDNMTIYKNPTIAREVIIGGVLNRFNINTKPEGEETIVSPVTMLRGAPTGYPYITKTEDGNAMVSSYLLIHKDQLESVRILKNGSPTLIDEDDYAQLGISEVDPTDAIQTSMIYNSMKTDIGAKQQGDLKYNLKDYYIVPADVLYKKTELMTDLQQTEQGRQSLRIK